MKRLSISKARNTYLMQIPNETQLNTRYTTGMTEKWVYVLNSTKFTVLP